MVISNVASGAYSAVTLKAHNANKGGILTLRGDVTVVANALNTNGVLFDSETAGLTNQGVIALNDVRTFDVRDGAAPLDLVVTPSIALVNGVTNGGLVKTGAGTLLLGGTNTYTAATSVSNGVLSIAGKLVSPVTIYSGAVLTGTGWIATNGANAVTVEANGLLDPGDVGTTGTLTVTGNVRFAPGGGLRVDATVGGGADLLAVSGAVTADSGAVPLTVAANGIDSWRVMTASGGITASFSCQTLGLAAAVRNGGTELWVVKQRGSVVLLR
jgi:autotransporter-associated beta strand protein